MGDCTSITQDEVSRHMTIKEKIKDENNKHTILLLGTASSGKTTLLRSIKTIHGFGWGTLLQNCMECSHVIRQNCVGGILTLIQKAEELYAAYDGDEKRDIFVPLYTVNYTLFCYYAVNVEVLRPRNACAFPLDSFSNFSVEILIALQL